MEIYISKKANLKIALPINVERAKRISLRVIVVLSILSLGLGIACLSLSLGGQTARDNKAPDVRIKDINIAIGGTVPTPIDFVESADEISQLQGEFIGGLPSMKSPGEYSAKVRYYDDAGNKTKVFDVKMNLIYDSTPPTIKTTKDIFVYVGESVAYRSAVAVYDNCIGEIDISVDDSLVDIFAVGDYQVGIVAADAVGNKSAVTYVTVHVISREDAKEKLDGKIAGVVNKIITREMTTEQKCRAIYEYIQENIEYTPVSYKGEWALAAYNALFVTGEGDCYSYFSAAKAFFDYLGIESLKVQRTSGYTDDTHFWNLVNIGDNGEDRWYHFDATVMRSEYAINSCLLTDEQIAAYGNLRPFFYDYDKSGYPPVESKIITANPNIDIYIGQ